MTATLSPVVTGVGVVAPTGSDLAAHWATVLAGRSCLMPLQHFDASSYPPQLAGHVLDRTLDDHLPSRLRVQTDRVTKMSLRATSEALSAATVRGTLDDLAGFGVVTSLSAGGFEFGEGELRNLWRQGAPWVTAYQAFAWFYAVNTGQISIAHGCKGPSTVTANEHDGGLVALDMAQRFISRGTPGMIYGGFEATLSSWGVTARESDCRLAHATTVEGGYSPWGRNGHGYSIGEGGASLVLEHPEYCRTRGGRALAQIRGVALARTIAEESLLDTLTYCINEACEQARVAPNAIDLVLADGLGTAEFDQQEAEAIRRTLPKAAVTIPKRGTGRLLAGGAALDLATAVAAINNQCLPPTPGPRYSTFPGTSMVWEPTPADVKNVVLLALDPRGTTGAAVICRPNP